MIYFIYYHTASPEQDNTKIVETIKSFPGWAILGSTFFLVMKEDIVDDDTDTNLLSIRQRLREAGASTDEFFIGQMGDEAVWQGYGAPLKQWLLKYSQKSNDDDESFRSKS